MRKMLKNTTRIMAMSLLLSIALAGCGVAGTKQSTTGTSDKMGTAASQESKAKQEFKKIRIGVMSDAGAVPFVIAEQQGFFAKKGLDVKITVFKSAVDRDTALQTGNLEGAMTDMLSIILFKEAGVDVKMTSDTYGNYRLITAKTLDAAKFGKLDKVSIGLSSNTVIDFATQKIAEAKGFQAKLNKTAIPQMPVRLEMLKAGKIDGATLPEPLATAAVIDGGAPVSSTEELKLYPAIFIMTQAALKDNSAGIKAMYEAYNEAVAYLNGKKTDEFFDFLVTKLGFPPELKGKFQLPGFTKIGAPDAATFKVTSDWMKEMGLAKNIYKYEDLSDTSLLPK